MDYKDIDIDGANEIVLDMEKLEKAFFRNLQRNHYCEYGGIGLDDKRPFGNSDVEDNILEIVGAEPCGEYNTYTDTQREYARDLYDALPAWLKRKYA